MRSVFWSVYPFARGSVKPAQNYGNILHKKSFLSILIFYTGIC
jgi:hypothetical protein